MSYGLVIDGVLQKTMNDLPPVWENISNLSALPNERLVNLSWAGHEGIGFYPIEEAQRPTVNENTEKAEFYYEVDEDNALVLGLWRVIALTAEELTQRQEEEQQRVEGQWSSVRGQRNELLRLTDWTQLADCVLTAGEKEAWRNYRQALRDVPNQADPFAIVWPDSPDPNIS